MLDLSEAGARITELEALLDANFRRNPAKESFAAFNREIDEHNKLAQRANDELEASAAQLEEQIAQLRGIEARIEDLQEQLKQQRAL